MYNKDKIIQVMREIRDESLNVKPYVVVAQPRRIEGEIPAQNFQNKGPGYPCIHADFNGFSHGFVDIFGQKVDVARNYLIERILESDAKYMFFIGEDTVIPVDAFLKLHETAEKNPGTIVTGVYYIKISSPMVMIRTQDDFVIPANVDPGQVIEAYQTGMDCMLIPVEVLRKLKQEDPEIPFCCIGHGIEDIPFIGEDNFFVYRLRKAGIKLLVNTDVQCLHVDLATGKYTAHPSVDLSNYWTNIEITEPLQTKDKMYIDMRWSSRIPGDKNTTIQEKIAQWQQEQKEIKLNLGCGDSRLDNYINVDIDSKFADVIADVTSLDLAENSIDEIYASHMIEHIHHFKVPDLLASWNRALKPEKKLILELPDMEALCTSYLEGDENQKELASLCLFGTFGNYLHSPHVWGYSKTTLSNLLIATGFKNVQITTPSWDYTELRGMTFRIEAEK